MYPTRSKPRAWRSFSDACDGGQCGAAPGAHGLNLRRRPHWASRVVRSVVVPANSQEVAAILRFANENQLVVTPRGSGTKMGWGNAVTPEIVLSLARMNAVREHSWQDMTCTVEAGCRWSALQSSLAQHGQMVALDPLWPERTTVGGAAACNDSGPMRLKYGSLRDLILGMTVVLADGTIAKTGGKVVKNVAGYDLHKLMTGSFGTLGVMTEINFRLHPLEEHARTWTIAADTESLHALMMRVLDSTMPVSAMQLRGLHVHGSDGAAAGLDVRLSAHPDCLIAEQKKLHTMSSGLEIVAGEETIWQARERLFDDAMARDGVLFKATMLPSQIAAAHRKLAEWGVESACVTQAGGVMTAAVFDGDLRAELLLYPLREMLRESGGSLVVLRVPGALHAKTDVWGCNSDALPLMREIKRQFDPNRILNPGRFVGDL